MHPPKIDVYADLLLDYCARVAKGDVVALNVETPAMPLARALVRGVLSRDAIPRLHLTYPEWTQDLVACAGDGFLDSAPEIELHEIRATDAYVRVAAPTNSRALQDADPQVLGRIESRQRPVQDHRVAHTRWVGTLFPTASGAQDAGMSLDAFERFVFGAMHLDADDPVAAWGRVEARQARLIERLAAANEVRIRNEHSDVRLQVGGRTWINSAGRRNMPSGEVFTGPIEDSAEGTIYFDVPSYVSGQVVRGVTLRFEAGQVVEAHAEQGQALLDERLERDPGARRLGELGIGTNDAIHRPIGSTLYDEKIGGTVHLALGRSYAESGGTNQSAIHWDLIADLRRGGEVTLDGEPFQRDGRFVDEG
ncbi:MAG: aminopeptidase [Trueperaceae bacterium]